MIDNLFFIYLFTHLSILLITFLHEMGHALFAVLFSKREVKVFLGTYGDTDKTKNFSFKVGLFHFYIRKNIYKWSGGLCINSGGMSINQTAIHILAGPFFPFLISALLLLVIKNYGNIHLYGFSLSLFVISILSFIFNLFPRKKALTLKSGVVSPNDGYLLLKLLKYSTRYPEYVTAINLYNEKKYNEAILIFKRLIEKGLKDDDIITLAFSSALMAKKFEVAEEIINEYGDSIEPDANHHINMGYLYSNRENHEKAMEHYLKSLKLNETWLAFNNIGYHLNLSGNYTEALGYFDKAIAMNPHAYPFNNRGLAKIKLGNFEEGLADLEHGHKLDPANSYYYKNKGIYYYDLNEYPKALEYFKKAREMDADTYKIDFDIEQTEQQLAKLNI